MKHFLNAMFARFVVGGLSAGGHLAAMTALESGAEIGLAGGMDVST